MREQGRRIRVEGPGEGAQQSSQHLIRIEGGTLFRHGLTEQLGDVTLPPGCLYRDRQLRGAGRLQRYRDMVGDGHENVDVVGGEHALGRPAVQVDDAAEAPVEQQRRDHDAAQAVDLHTAGPQVLGVLGTGDHHRLSGTADPVHQRGAVGRQLLDVVSFAVAPEVRYELVEVGVDQEQVRALGTEDAYRLVERDPGQLARVEHGGGGEAHLLQGREPPPVQGITDSTGTGRAGAGRPYRLVADLELGAYPAGPVRPLLVHRDHQ